MAAETKAETKARLMGEGRWGEFTKARKALVGQGKSAEEAHALALADFPPDGAKKPVKAEEPARPRSKGPDLKREMHWVYENLDAADPKGAPSKGAREMHRLFAASDATKLEFLTMYIQRTVGPKGSQRDDDPDKPDAGAELCQGLLQKWLDQRNASDGGQENIAPMHA